ncbi:hypothetical protein [Streptomyces sp. NPDC001889]
MLGSLRLGVAASLVTLTALIVATVRHDDAAWIPAALWVLWPLWAIGTAATAYVHRPAK